MSVQATPNISIREQTMPIHQTWRGTEYRVQEYFLFDPLREYLPEGLVGFRVEQGEYSSLRMDDQERIFSNALQVFLRPEDSLLRVIDPQTGQPVPSLDEAMLIAEQEAQRAERLAAQLRAMGIEPKE